MPTPGKWYEDLDAVARDAAGALDRDRRPSLFDRLDWFRLTRTHVLPEAKLAVVAVSDTWLFLIENAPRRAAPLGSWYSLRFGPIGDPAPLFRAAARRFDRIALHPLDDATMRVTKMALRENGWRAFTTRISTSWTIDLASQDFAAYWAARPAQLRNTVTRRSRSHPLDIRIHRAFDAKAWADYEAIYAASWKPSEGSLPFLRALAEQEGTAGALRLGIARDPAGRAVAAQLWLVEGGIATIHKLAHREDTKAGSPGSILSHAMFRAAIDEDRVHRIDFGLGDEPYKADWMGARAPIWRIDAYRPATLRGLFGIAREIASRLARRRPLD